MPLAVVDQIIEQLVEMAFRTSQLQGRPVAIPEWFTLNGRAYRVADHLGVPHGRSK